MQCESKVFLKAKKERKNHPETPSRNKCVISKDQCCRHLMPSALRRGVDFNLNESAFLKNSNFITYLLVFLRKQSYEKIRVNM